MKAMVLAAGLGTRLRPLTDDRPKALVEVAGRTMLELTLERLKRFGVRETIVNTHHHAATIEDYLRTNDGFGMRIEISREDDLLDTGGGLKKAAWFFLDGDARGGGAAHEERPQGAPFLVHNVDVLSQVDLCAMLGVHRETGALATLAVQARPASRQLLFDRQGRLTGRKPMDDVTDSTDLHPRKTELTALAFCGIHVLSPAIFAEMKQVGPFSIVDAYLDLARKGARIGAFRADGAPWRDLGRPESVAEAAKEIAAGMYRT